MQIVRFSFLTASHQLRVAQVIAGAPYFRMSIHEPLSFNKGSPKVLHYINIVMTFHRPLERCLLRSYNGVRFLRSNLFLDLLKTFSNPWALFKLHID